MKLLTNNLLCLVKSNFHLSTILSRKMLFLDGKRANSLAYENHTQIVFRLSFELKLENLHNSVVLIGIEIQFCVSVAKLNLLWFLVN